MVSLRSASSPSSTRSGSRENTPEPDPTPNRRRSSRTSQIAARRKSSRLSVASVPPAETKQSETSVSTTDQSLACQKEGTKVAKSDVQPVDEHKTPQGAGQVDQIASNAKDEDKENVEIVARSEKEDSPLTDQDEVSSPRSSRSSDALALIEAQKYIQPTSRRRRSTPRVFDEPSTEEESELQQEVVAKVDVEVSSASFNSRRGEILIIDWEYIDRHGRGRLDTSCTSERTRASRRSLFSSFSRTFTFRRRQIRDSSYIRYS